jgi:hypothetical protein
MKVLVATGTTPADIRLSLVNPSRIAYLDEDDNVSIAIKFQIPSCVDSIWKCRTQHKRSLKYRIIKTRQRPSTPRRSAMLTLSHHFTLTFMAIFKTMIEHFTNIL